MKNFKAFFSLLILAGILLTFNSCEQDEPYTGGNITEDMTWSGEIDLMGTVHVKAPAVLTIEAGTKITADASDLTYLLVEQGAKIIAEGTASNPIVFTATDKSSGAWGGLHICGKAPINSGDTGLSEIGDAIYGGTDAADNSGVLKYVTVEYSGTALDSEHEANGISFYGVGSGTEVDNIEIYIGNDDGIEFFGGTVCISHCKVVGAQDDSFDWTEGWSGKGQYLIAVQLPDYPGDRGFEGDNLGSNNTAEPYANPTFSQVTLIGDGIDDGYGMKLREGTKGKIYNFIVTGFDKRSIHVEHDQTLLNVIDGSLMVDYGYVNSVVTDLPIKYSTTEGSSKPSGLSDHYFEKSSNIHIENLSDIDASKTYSGGKDASTINSWFTSDSNIGAGSGWTSWMVSAAELGSGSTLNTTTSLSGEITVDTWVVENATLSGTVHVKNGATLNIKAGVTITADASDLSYLLIEQGAKINAVGTASAPIVLTANDQSAGAWGGLHICGKASINSGATGLSEIGDAVYGGTADDDNSGVIQYVRVEYSGTALDSEHEANGISCYGVGSGTTIDHVQIYVGNDDGIEFFGGTCNIKHAYVYACGDDSYDWTEGWRGKGQFLIAVQDANIIDGDRGFEGDNLGSNNTAEPYASPMISNITLIGDGVTDGYGMKLREGTKGKFYNAIVTNFDKRSIHVEHDQTLLNVCDGSLIVDYSYVNDQVSDAAIKYSATEGSEKPANLADHQFEKSSNIFIQNLMGIGISQTYSGGYDMSAVDSFFEQTDFIGAGSDWTAGWTK
ncbi:MAG: hypothetical protein JW798_12880 [Prolixibacteraceae bacterium]|nr:hypothetical protein [Prolixibacteraceae bacterium]